LFKTEAIIKNITQFRREKLKYSNTNPPYLEEDAARFIRESGIKHLLIDLPVSIKKMTMEN
jgi:hypothetical protein